MIEESAIRPTRVEIDLDALRANASLLRAMSGTALYAVVKADAYGHGAPAVCRALAAGGQVSGFAVSLVEEGVELRDAGIDLPILVMGPAQAGGCEEMVDRELLPLIASPGDLDGLSRAALRRGRRIPVHLKIDTGMGRLGILPGELGAVIARLPSLPGIEVVGLATHFACADTDDPGDPDCMTYAQLRCFDEVVATARAQGLGVRVLHTANSAAALLFPGSRRDLVRCGLALYGNGPRSRAQGLRQAMRLVSRIAQLRDLPAGATVSYGALWRASRPSRVAVVPIGYADGVPRRLTGVGQVLVGGQRCALVGAVSMDIAMVDVTDLGPEIAQVGAEVVLLGPQGNDCISTRELAAWGGLTEYEITCGMSKRVPRVYGGTAARVREAGARERVWPARSGLSEATP